MRDAFADVELQGLVGGGCAVDDGGLHEIVAGGSTLGGGHGSGGGEKVAAVGAQASEGAIF
jgi:hypothetical protein